MWNVESEDHFEICNATHLKLKKLRSFTLTSFRKFGSQCQNDPHLLHSPLPFACA